MNNVTTLILTESTPYAIEGLLGFLMTRSQSGEKLNKLTIVAKDPLPIMNQLNEFAMDDVFDGSVL